MQIVVAITGVFLGGCILAAALIVSQAIDRAPAHAVAVVASAVARDPSRLPDQSYDGVTVTKDPAGTVEVHGNIRR